MAIHTQIIFGTFATGEMVLAVKTANGSYMAFQPGNPALTAIGEDADEAMDNLAYIIDNTPSDDAEPDYVDRQAARFDHERDLRKHG